MSMLVALSIRVEITLRPNKVTLRQMIWGQPFSWLKQNQDVALVLAPLLYDSERSCELRWLCSDSAGVDATLFGSILWRRLLTCQCFRTCSVHPWLIHGCKRHASNYVVGVWNHHQPKQLMVLLLSPNVKSMIVLGVGTSYGRVWTVLAPNFVGMWLFWLCHRPLFSRCALVCVLYDSCSPSYD